MKKLNFMTTFRFLWQYVRDMKWKYAFFYVGWLFHTIVGVIAPILFGNMIDEVIYENDLRGFLRMSLFFLGMTLFGIALYYIIYETYGCLWNGMNRRLRAAMFEQLQHLEASELTSLQHGDTANMIQFWSNEGVHFMIRNVVHNANNLFRILLYLVFLFRINPVFGIVSVVMVPVSVSATFAVNDRIRANSRKNKEAYSGYMGWLFEIAGSFSELRLWRAEESVLQECDGRLKEMNRLTARIEMDNTLGEELLANVKNVVLVIQYGVLAHFAVSGDVKVGTITVLLSFFTMLASSLSQFVGTNLDAQKRIAVVEKICRFLEKKRIDDKALKSDLREAVADVTFENCSFGYRGQADVLDNVSFSLRQGEKVAVTGASGAGKSTLLNLLLGLYEPSAGRILLNGKSITAYRTSSLYDHVSAVFQQVLLFRGTIRENLQMGEAIPEDELVRACKAADIHDYVLAQEDGFDAVLENGGKNLSGGQRQRLGLARAYLKKSDLVVLDEATSALDAETEAEILRHWEEALHGRACIVVSHRLSTVMHCDRVILLKDGKISAMGTPAWMREQCREFRELFAL